MSDINYARPTVSSYSIPTTSELIGPPRPPVSDEKKQKALEVLEKTSPLFRTFVALRICSFLEPHDSLRQSLLEKEHQKVASCKHDGPFAYCDLLRFYYDQRIECQDLTKDYLASIDKALTQPRWNTAIPDKIPEVDNDLMTHRDSILDNISQRHHYHFQQLCNAYGTIDSLPLREELLKKILNFRIQHPAVDLSGEIDRDIICIEKIYRCDPVKRAQIVSNVIHNAACLEDMEAHIVKLKALISVLALEPTQSFQYPLTKEIRKEILFSFGDTWNEKVASNPDLEDAFRSKILSLAIKISVPELFGEILLRYPPNPTSPYFGELVRYTIIDEKVLEIIEKLSPTEQLNRFRRILESCDYANENIKKSIFQKVVGIFDENPESAGVTAYDFQFFLTYSQELYTHLNKHKEKFYDTTNNRIQIEASLLKAACDGAISIPADEKNLLRKSLYQALDVEWSRRENYEPGLVDSVKKITPKKVSVRLFFADLIAPLLPQKKVQLLKAKVLSSELLAPGSVKKEKRLSDGWLDMHKVYYVFGALAASETSFQKIGSLIKTLKRKPEEHSIFFEHTLNNIIIEEVIRNTPEDLQADDFFAFYESLETKPISAKLKLLSLCTNQRRFDLYEKLGSSKLEYGCDLLSKGHFNIYSNYDQLWIPPDQMREGLRILQEEDKVYYFLANLSDHSNGLSHRDLQKPSNVTPTIEQEELRNSILTAFSDAIIDALKDAPSLDFKNAKLIRRVCELAEFFNLPEEARKLKELYFTLADRMAEIPWDVISSDTASRAWMIPLIKKLPDSLDGYRAEQAIEILFEA